MSVEIGVFAAFTAMLAWGLGDFFIQRSVRIIGNLESLFFIGLFGSLALFPFIIEELFTQHFFSLFFPFFLFLGGLGFMLAVINFQALKIGKLSVIEPILELELPLTLLLGVLFFQEIISSFQLLLILFIFIGIVFISLKKFTLPSQIAFFEKGFFLALITAIGLGFFNFFIAVFARNASPLFAVWSIWIMLTVFSFSYLAWKKQFTLLIRKAHANLALVFAESFFDTLAWIAFAIAVVSLPLAITVSITESYIAIAVLLGVVVNKEKLAAHQKIGIIFALSGAFFLALLL